MMGALLDLASAVEAKEGAGKASNRPSADAAGSPSVQNGFSEDKLTAEPETPRLEMRIRAMAKRWQYSEEDLALALHAASVDRAGWLTAVAFDEQREAEFRALGYLPRTDS
jgi:hypothetical protein